MILSEVGGDATADLSGGASVDELDADRPWEPRALKIGDQVRVRLSGECRTTFIDTFTGEVIRHRPVSDGKVGVVTQIDHDDEGHSYFVKLDQRVYDPDSGLWYGGGDFAAIELELVEVSQ